MPALGPVDAGAPSPHALTGTPASMTASAQGLRSSATGPGARRPGDSWAFTVSTWPGRPAWVARVKGICHESRGRLARGNATAR
jgi:hypothetical protein